MNFCNRDFSCGGCMDVDNQNTKLNHAAPQDSSKQFEKEMKSLTQAQRDG